MRTHLSLIFLVAVVATACSKTSTEPPAAIVDTTAAPPTTTVAPATTSAPPRASTTATAGDAPPTCNAGEVFGYVNEIPGRGFCSKACTSDADCIKGQSCVDGQRTNETTMGAAAANRNYVQKCITKPKK